ncbi:MAG: hypothetical protein ACYCST_20785 [Acidimicrobiales bacterium]
MDFGHGFLPRIDARNYKAVERCLPGDGPGLFHEALELPWAILEGPWAIEHGASSIELCRNRGISFLVDTQAWRYRDARTFRGEKFTATPYAPAGPLTAGNSSALRDFVEADLKTQASLGASAYLLPGIVPRNARDDVRAETLALLEIAETKLPGEPRPCIAFVGAHTSSLETAHQLIDELPHWIDGVYLQLTPVNPLLDSASKIMDCLMLLHYATQQGFTVVAGRLAGLAPLLRAMGISGSDAGLGDGESFVYSSKIRSYEPKEDTGKRSTPLAGRLYVPQLGRSASSSEWARLMQVPALRGQLLCHLRCCEFAGAVETAPRRGREHSLNCRVTEAKSLPSAGRYAIDAAIALLEQRQSAARTVAAGLLDAGLDPIATEFIDNHLAVARYLRDANSQAA